LKSKQVRILAKRAANTGSAERGFAAGARYKHG
jgi:hypothetical protein